MLPQGYGGLLGKLQASLDVRLRHAVTRVARTAAGVRVEVTRPDGGAMALEVREYVGWVARYLASCVRCVRR